LRERERERERRKRKREARKQKARRICTLSREGGLKGERMRGGGWGERDKL